MIYLGEISNVITEKHWDYFKEFGGFAKIEEYKNDNTLTQDQRALFSFFYKNNLLLKKVLVGNPSELRNAVCFYYKRIICKDIYLRFYNDFIFDISWSDVWRKINTEALNEKSERVKSRKRYLDRRFTEIENLLGLVVDTNYNIGTFEKRYKNIQSKVIEYVVSWNEKLTSIFDYDRFTIKGTEWNAYKYTHELGVTVCPYCNRNYIHTIETNSGSTRAKLDHFYPKSLYPFLSISLYNLIPCCQVCNSDLKGSKNFLKNRHLHPFEDNNHNKVKFKLDFKKEEIENSIPNIDEFEIGFKLNNELDDLGKVMINNSINTFKTKELYNNHKDIALEIISNAICYSETKREELKTILGESSGIDENFIDRVVYGNYIQQSDFGKRPLAKFTSNIITFLKEK